jgi:hypothetical protein
MREREYQDKADEFAGEAYDQWAAGTKNEIISDWMDANAGAYAQGLVRGGDYYHAALREMRKDCLPTLAEAMIERVEEYYRDQADEYAEEI